MKVYGPYTRTDGRQHVCIIGTDGYRKTQSYPRYLMEQALGRELLDNETVDHIDNDFTNNAIDNLQVISRQDNARKEMCRTHRKRKYVSFECPICGTIAEKPENYIKHNRNLGKAGPFCSRKCAGIYSTT